MSRVGKLPVKVPENVNVIVAGQTVSVTGPKGTLKVNLPKEVGVAVENGQIKVSGEMGNLQGLIRSELANAVTGVAQGWNKSLELSGTGYRASVAGNTLQMALGYSHPVTVTAPEGIGFVVKENLITVSGADRQTVGQIAAIIRAKRPADPYKAKGLKYDKEVIVRKPGKAAKAGGGK